MKRLATRLEIKDMTDTGQFTGYASVFGVEDQGQDIVVRGAYTDTLQARGAQGIKMLYEHDPSKPIGFWKSLVEDDHGLLATGQLLVDSLDKAREVYALMRNHIVDGLSIGYRVIKSRSDRSSQCRILEQVDLREISAVMFPMNEQSLITGVKGQLPTEREFERWLTQDAGLTRSQARQIIAGGFKSLTSKPGAGEGGREMRGMLADLDRLASAITATN